LQKVVDSGGIADLPDSAEAATMATIDSLSPEERTVVRHAAVFGLTFHPRMVAWFAGEEGFSAPTPAVWGGLSDLFDEEPDGYMRFRRSLLRDAAYAGLPYKLRRRLHGIVAARLEEELDYPEDIAGILSLHYFEAGEYQLAWRYATTAAKRAESAYADVEAAGLYTRALEAARQLKDLEPRELATLQQSIGDSWYRAGEFRKASEAYTAARPLAANDALLDAGLLHKLSYVEAKVGQYTEALRWAAQARTILERLSGPQAAQQIARSSAWYALVHQYEGQTAEALDWAERAVTDAETANDAEALGDAYSVLGWAFAELGKEGAQSYFQKALEVFGRIGNLIRQQGILVTLGVVSQWEGRWDEAMSYYNQGRDLSLKIGDTLGVALARDNVAEILIDRGEWTDAEASLKETKAFWAASQHRYYHGLWLKYLGRVLLRTGRFEEALRPLEEARTTLLQVGAESEVPPVDARIAECRLAMGQVDAALELVRGMLGRASESNGVAKVGPLLERIQAHALLQQGDLWGARDALEASLAAAKERNDLFEETLTQLSLIELDRLEGIEPPLEMVAESRERLARFKVRAVPPVPLPQQ